MHGGRVISLAKQNALSLIGIVTVATAIVSILLSHNPMALVVSGSLFAAGVGCLLANVGFKHSAELQRKASRDAEATALRLEQKRSSAELAVALHATRNHANRYFANTHMSERVELRNVNFEGANFDDATWTSAVIEDCSFLGSSLMRSEVLTVWSRSLNFRGSVLVGSTISGSVMNCDFRGTACDAVDFTRARISNTSFASTPLSATTLTRANFEDCRDVELVDFTQVNAEGLQASEALMLEANFSNAFLLDSVFDEARLLGCSFRGAMFSGLNIDRCASFVGTEFSDPHGFNPVPTDFSNAWLLGVDLSTAKGLSQATFSGALANEGTKFPDSVNPKKLGIYLLHEMPVDEAYGHVQAWRTEYGRPAGWT